MEYDCTSSAVDFEADGVEAGQFPDGVGTTSTHPHVCICLQSGARKRRRDERIQQQLVAALLKVESHGLDVFSRRSSESIALVDVRRPPIFLSSVVNLLRLHRHACLHLSISIYNY
jgi:hypothetical protein